MMHQTLGAAVALCLLAGSIGCGATTTSAGTSTASGASGSSDAGGSSGGSGSEVKLSGQITVLLSDLKDLSAVPPSEIKALTKNGFKLATTSPVANATVSLIQINADGTSKNVATATADADGKYAFANVPVATGGTGKATDFYYQVKAVSGALTVLAPAAPSADTTVDITPESHLAAKMLTDVAAKSGDVLPRPEAIENVRQLTVQEVGTDLKDNIKIPSLGVADAVMVAHATAIGANNGNAEKALRAFESEKEAIHLKSVDAVTADVGAYLETVGKQGCNYNANFKLPETVRDAIAGAFKAGTQIVMSDLVKDFNLNTRDPAVNSDAAVTKISGILSGIGTAVTNKTAITAENQMGLFVKRDLGKATFGASTKLDVDQALGFTQELFQQRCQVGSFDMVGFTSDLLGDSTLKKSDIADVQIFTDSTGDCNQPNKTLGHLNAKVDVYSAAAVTVKSVTITRSDNSKSKTLTQDGNGGGHLSHWSLPVATDTDFFCIDVSQAKTIDTTIHVDFTGAAAVDKKVTRTYVNVPEADIKFIKADAKDVSGTAISRDQNAPTPIDVKRPVFKWTPPPGKPAADIIKDAPAGSELKFTFELAYIDVTDPQPGPLSQCKGGGSGNKLIDRNYFIADADCDIAACAKASGRTAANLRCRAAVQTWLVDANDRLLGQGAGAFRFYQN